MKLPSLKAIYTFEVVARLGVISQAAEELNLTPSAVSHQLANLESHIGRALFTRTARGVELTPAGERYRQGLAGAIAVIAGATDNARDEGIEVLRIQSSPSFVSLWLMPRLSRFMEENPDIQIRLAASHVYSDFSRGEADIDIRYGVPVWRDLHVESLYLEEVLPLISPQLKERLHIQLPENLLKQNLILSSNNVIQWPRWFAAQGVTISPSHYALSFDRTHLSIQAAIQGLGIMLESHRLAEDAIHNGLLVPVFADRKSVQVHAHHLVCPHSHMERKKVQRFVSWLRSQT
ncbi:MAG: LysR family transcriptional regulator [Gammaproteobacteria bacterium]|nr:LysR family transcriptional regulator [Gammaproteobacteria bacterium]